MRKRANGEGPSAAGLFDACENSSMDEKKKTFISEKIIGRELDKRLVARWLLLALLCGLVFGLSAAFAFSAVEQANVRRAERELDEERAEQAADVMGAGSGSDAEHADLAAGGAAENTVQTGQDAAGNAVSGNGTLEPAGGSAGAADAAGLQGAEGSQDQLAALVEAAVENRSYTAEDYRRLMGSAEELTAAVDKHVVAVTAVATNTTWFDDTVERTQTFAGLVLSAEDPEILILTTEAAVQSAAKLAVTFADGTQKEAVVKQQSHTDQLAVLAVAKEGLGSDFLTALEPVKLGSTHNIRAGSAVIAAGAPLGQVHSYDVGLIGYVGEGETAVDGLQTAYYLDIAADAKRGTYLMDLSGNLIGVATGQTGEDSSAGSVRFVSISQLRRILAKLEAGSAAAYLGITGKDISFEMQYSNIPKGMYVTEVATDSPAYAAGVKRGDIVTQLGDTPIEDVADYEAVFRRLLPGDSVKATVQRKSTNSEYRDMAFTLTVGNR